MAAICVLICVVAGPERAQAQLALAAPTITSEGPVAVDEGETAVTTLAATDEITDTLPNEAPRVAGTQIWPLEPVAPRDRASDSLPPTPDPPTVYDNGLNELTVRWTEPDNADPAITGYDLEYRHRDSTDWLSGPQDQTGTRATITGLDPDKNYYVRVRAENSNGAGAWSEAGEGTTALYVGTMTTGDGSGYRGYRRYRGEPYGGINSLGQLVPRALTYDGDEYRIITMAWCRCTRIGADGRHTTAVDLYSLFHEIPDEWVLRVGNLRLLLSEAQRADLGTTGLKSYWPHISPGWVTGREYEVSLSRNPLLSSSGSGVIRGPLTAELIGVPNSHNGSSAFQFTLRFSEDVKNRRSDILGSALTVVGGSISDATQGHEATHREWQVTIEPDGGKEVSITLQGDRDCATTGAVCTEDGRRLSQTVARTVRGPHPPTISGQTQFSFAENSTGVVGRFTASDPDTRRLTWQSPTGADAADFTMDGSGNLRFRRSPDFEAPADADANNVYEVTVRVSDGLQTAMHNVTVAVTDRNERPRAANDEARTLEDEPVTVNVLSNDTDPDAGDTLTLRVVSAQRGTVSIDPDRTVVFTPESNYHGGGRLTYEIEDSQGLTARARVRIEIEAVNDPPRFSSATASRAISESARQGAAVGARVTASDPDSGDTMRYELDPASDLFTIDASSGQIRVKESGSLDYESAPSHRVTVKASDSSNSLDTIEVTITVTNVNEAPEADDDQADVDEDDSVSIDVLANDSDPEFGDLTVSVNRQPRNGTASVDPLSNEIVYSPRRDYHGSDSFSYRVRDEGGLTDTAEVALFVRSLNDPPRFATGPQRRQVVRTAQAGDNVGTAVTATDVDGESLTYALSGPDASSFEIDSGTGQVMVASGVAFDPLVQSEYVVTVEARDQDFARGEVSVTITVVERVRQPTFGGGGGGGGFGGGAGGAPAVILPSDEDFDYNKTRDLKDLDDGHEVPTDLWSDGETVWLLNNAPSGADAIYAYELGSGERVEERDVDLDRRNRFSHGIWSNGETVWIADSGEDQLFAYRLASGERAEDRDIDLAERNRDPRGIWSDGETLYVLDSVKDALFTYSVEAGKPLAEHALASLNRSPRGIWSDGVTIWISDDGASRIFAYRFNHEGELVRNEDEAEEFSFRPLLKAGNSDIRGIWSDGAIMYAVDGSDGKVYSYNMPDAIQAALSELSLSGIDLGIFATLRLAYSGAVTAGVDTTTVTATATQERATVVVEPADADAQAEGHQLALVGLEAVSITVTSADESRTRTYRITLNRANHAPVGSSVEALTLQVDGEIAELTLTELFSDADGDELEFSVEAEPSGVVEVGIAGGVARISPIAAGQTVVRLSASDGKSSSDPITLQITVEAAPEPIEETPEPDVTHVRIAAQRLADGRMEFALQTRGADGTWSDRLLPSQRFLSADSTIERWANSSAVTVVARPETGDRVVLRVSARRVQSGSVEFALQQQNTDGTWAERRLPQMRFVSATASVGRWLQSSELNLDDGEGEG